MTPEQRHNRFLLGSLSLGHLTNDWVAGTLWLLAPAIAASMGLGPSEVGLILAINGLGAGLAYIPAGVLADRVSRPGVLMLITFWWIAIGYFCATLAEGFWLITLLLAFGVMGDAFWHPVATGVLVKQMPTRRAQVLGIHAMGGSIGSEVLGPVTTGFLLGYFSWQTTLQILVLPAVIMGFAFILIAQRIGESVHNRMSAVDFKNLLLHWRSLQGLRLALLMIFYNMSLMAMLAMTPLFLQTQHQMEPLSTSLVFAAMLLIGTAAQPFIGKFSDRIGRRSIILTILLCAVGFSLFAGLSGSLPAFIGTVLISIVLLTAVRPVVLAAAVEFSDKSEATTLGIVFALLDGVGALGAACAGFIGEVSLNYAYFLAAFLSLAAAMLCANFPFASTKNS